MCKNLPKNSATWDCAELKATEKCLRHVCQRCENNKKYLNMMTSGSGRGKKGKGEGRANGEGKGCVVM